MLSALKNFAVTFVISILIFGIIAYFATIFVTDTMTSILDNEKEELDHIIQNPDGNETGDDPVKDPVTDPDLPAGESFELLLVTTDYRPDLYDNYHPDIEKMYQTNWEVQDPTTTLGCLSGDYRDVNITSLVLVCIDKETKSVVYTYISPNSRVYTPVGYSTLNDVYHYYGSSSVISHVYAMTGIDPEYTFVIEGYNIDDLVEIVGETTVNIGKNIYTDGKYNSMQYQSTIYKTDENGKEVAELVTNQYVVGQGDVILDGYYLFNVVSAIEHSASDITAKEAYMVSIAQKYLNALAGLENEMLYEAVTTLLKIPGSESDEITDETTDTVDTSVNEKPIFPEDFIIPGEPYEPEEDTPEVPWKNKLEEPIDPIVSTNYTIAEYEVTSELFRAITEFESIVITYPGTYRARTSVSKEYFDPNIEEAINLFLPYRSTTNVQ